MLEIYHRDIAPCLISLEQYDEECVELESYRHKQVGIPVSLEHNAKIQHALGPCDR